MNDKIEKVLQLQRDGYNRDSIAKELGYQRVDSLQRYMRKNNYVYMNEKYVLTNDISGNKDTGKNEKDRKKLKDRICTEVKLPNSISRGDIQKKITPKLEAEYQNLKSNYSSTELKILGILFLSDSINENENKQDEKKSSLVKNVKTFIERAMKHDYVKTIDYLDSKKVPINTTLAMNENTDIKNIVYNNDELDTFLDHCSIEELEVIKKGLASMNSFSDNLIKALRRE